MENVSIVESTIGSPKIVSKIVNLSYVDNDSIYCLMESVVHVLITKLRLLMESHVKNQIVLQITLSKEMDSASFVMALVKQILLEENVKKMIAKVVKLEEAMVSVKIVKPTQGLIPLVFDAFLINVTYARNWT